MAKRRPAGDGMVRKREDGRWEGRIVIGHKENGEPLFRHVYAKTQKALLDKLHQNIECYRDVELCVRLLQSEIMLERGMVPDSSTYRSVFCTEGGDAPWMLDRAG